MPFLLAEILNYQGSTHLLGVGSFSSLLIIFSSMKTKNRSFLRKSAEVTYKNNILGHRS